MTWANKLIGWATGNGAEVDSNNRLLVALGQQSSDPAQVGGARLFSEVDQGLKLPGGSATLATLVSPEADIDYRLRVSHDTFLDEEIFDYAAQNSGKHTYSNTTMTATWATAGMTTNGGAITTTTTGIKFSSYASFPLVSTSTLSLDIEAAFTATGVANATIDFGLFTPGAANPYAPTDGAYFRLNSTGMYGVVNFNGSETPSTVFNFTPTANTKYQYILYVTRRQVEFWINSGTSTDLYAVIPTPAANANPFAAGSQPFAIRHAIAGGTAGAIQQMLIGSYNVRIGSTLHTPSLAAVGNRIYGSYQGLAGGTMGSLANYANSANPAPAVPTNTTAALGTGLGGQFWETASIVVNTDGVICSYAVPAGGINQPARRLVITGISLASYIQTVIAGGPFNAQWSLAFGHTNVSLATTETAAAKAPRRIALPQFTQLVTAAQAINTMVTQASPSISFANPIYVNPNEFVALVVKHVGTVGTSGTIAHVVAFDYGWE